MTQSEITIANQNKEEYTLSKREIVLLEKMFTAIGSGEFKPEHLILRQGNLSICIDGTWQDMPRYGYGLIKR